MTADFNALVIVGPTASGKSSLAMTLAQALDGEIVSFDSVQIYKGFDLGSAKPTLAERQRVPHHMIDACDWHQPYDAASFGRDARRKVAEIKTRGALPILVGGTGLYLRAYFGASFQDDLPSDPALRKSFGKLSNEELRHRLAAKDPERAASLHLNDRVRLERALEIVTLLGGPLPKPAQTQTAYEKGAYVIYLKPDRRLLHRKMGERVNAMLQQGLIEEVRGLLQNGVDPHCKPMQSIGYKQVASFLRRPQPAHETQLHEEIWAATRQYGKRQYTWFNKIPCDLIVGRLDDPALDAAGLQLAFDQKWNSR